MIGDAVLSFGRVDVDVTPSVKVDSKKASGKDGSSDSVERTNDPPVKITWTFDSRRWAEAEPIITSLIPDGEPRDLIHPKARLGNVKSVLIESGGVPDHDGGIYTVSWSGKGWNAPANELTTTLILRRGSTGPEVTRWQTFLEEQSFGESEGFSPVDGIFGELTENGTKGFQEREEITVDGIVGPETFGAASAYGYEPPPPTATAGGVVTPESAAQGAVDAIGNAASTVADPVADAVAGLFGAGDP